MLSQIEAIALAALAAGLAAFCARERRLRRAAAAARDGERRRLAQGFSELSGALAHELRNPLNTLSLTFQFLERLIGREAAKLDGRAQLEKHLGAGGGEIDKLRRAIDAFVELAKPRELAREQVDLGALVTHAVEAERVRRNGTVAGIDFAVEAAPTPASVDPKELRVAIDEVVANAVDAVIGAPAPRIEVRCGRDANGTARIVVRDSGAGFTSRALERVFEPYFTTKPEHAGLGLARARLIVEAHGGRVGAANRATAGGAEVAIEIPSPSGAPTTADRG